MSLCDINRGDMRSIIFIPDLLIDKYSLSIKFFSKKNSDCVTESIKSASYDGVQYVRACVCVYVYSALKNYIDFYGNLVYFCPSVCARETTNANLILWALESWGRVTTCVLMLPYAMQMLMIFCVTERVASDENSRDCGHAVH